MTLQYACLWNGYCKDGYQVSDHSHSIAVFQNKFGQSFINQIVIEWDQVSKCMQSLCDNTEIKCDNLTTYTGIHFNSLYKLFTIRVQPEPHRLKAVIQKFFHK